MICDCNSLSTTSSQIGKQHNSLFAFHAYQIPFFPPSHLKKSTRSNPVILSAIVFIIGLIAIPNAQSGNAGITLVNIKCPGYGVTVPYLHPALLNIALANVAASVLKVTARSGLLGVATSPISACRTSMVWEELAASSRSRARDQDLMNWRWGGQMQHKL